jgi:hypothetical protein
MATAQPCDIPRRTKCSASAASTTVSRSRTHAARLFRAWVSPASQPFAVLRAYARNLPVGAMERDSEQRDRKPLAK